MSPTPKGTGSAYDYAQYQTDGEITARESYRIKDGAGGKGIFAPDLIRDVPQFKPSLGVKVIDIVMARAGANHPLVVMGKLKEDQMTHICWVYVHKGIGPNQDWFICLARTYGHPCPICEYRTRLQADPDVPDETIRLYGTGRYPLGIYNVIHHLNPNQITWQEPVMVWPINNSFMESPLQTMCKSPIGGGYINYMWPTAGEQGGRHIAFEVVQKGQYFDYKGHQFILRQSPVPPHVLQAAYCLGDLLYIPEYDEVKEALEAGLGQPSGGEELQVGPEVHHGSVFGTPAPQQGMFPECKFGETFENFEECVGCTYRTQCQPPLPQQEPTSRPLPPQPPPGSPALGRAPIPRRPQR